MRFVVVGIEYEGRAHWGIGNAGPGDKVGLLIRQIPDNATQIHNSNVPDPDTRISELEKT